MKAKIACYHELLGGFVIKIYNPHDMAIYKKFFLLYLCKLKIWYNNFMDEKRKLKVLDRTDEKLDEIGEEQIKPEVKQQKSPTSQTNPIYKNLAKFNNSKIGEKLSIKDILR